MQESGRGPCFYLFSGEVPGRDAAGDPTYDYRTDGYAFDLATETWRALTPSPAPVAAACAAPSGQAHVLVFSGSTGAHVFEPDPRPEFPQKVRAYHTITDTWVDAGAMPRGHGFGAIDAAVLALYLIGLVAIGLRLKKRSESTDDFFLAGRRIPWWAAGISIFATQLSAITFVATPAVAYATDWLVLPGKAMILVMAPVVVLLYLPFFRRLDVTKQQLDAFLRPGGVIEHFCEGPCDPD